MDEKKSQKSLLIIGAGGIGTTVVDLLVPALDRIQLGAKITLMDGDTVEASNLGHQNYSPADIGKKKVDALAEKWSYLEKNLSKTNLDDSLLRNELTEWRLNLSRSEKIPAFHVLHNSTLESIVRERPVDLESLLSINRIGPHKIKEYGKQIIEIVLKYEKPRIRISKFLNSTHNIKMSKNKKRDVKIEIISKPINLSSSKHLEGYDLVIVCVDRPEPRRLVHALDVPWIDLRCSGDGWMVFTSDSNPNLVAQMTPDHEPMSCQVEGALDAGNLEFGFSIAGTFGAQWILQQLRGRRAPLQSIGSLTYGSFEFPKVSSPSMEVKA